MCPIGFSLPGDDGGWDEKECLVSARVRDQAHQAVHSPGSGGGDPKLELYVLGMDEVKLANDIKPNHHYTLADCMK